MLNLDFRLGNHHSQCEGTVKVLSQTLDSLRRLPYKKSLLRAYAAHDSVENFQAIERFNQKSHGVRIDFIIKHNPRQESVDNWLTLAKAQGQKRSPKEGKVVYIGHIQKGYPGLEDTFIRCIRSQCGTSTAAEQQLLVPDVRVKVYKTSLDQPPEVIIRLYPDHAASEQYHSQI